MNRIKETNMNLKVLIFLLMTLPLSAADVIEKAEKDEVFLVEKDNPDMLQAYKKARSSLHTFLAKYEESTAKDAFFIKVKITENDNTEYFWLNPITIKGDNSFVGSLSNEPQLVTNVVYGESISFSKADIYDWMYYENNKMYGNFTACALLKKESKEQREAFMQAYGLSCEN